MKKVMAVVALAAAFLLVGTPVAFAQTPTSRHIGVYFYLRRHVRIRFGEKAMGRDIVMYGVSPGHPASDADVVNSNAIMERRLAPQPTVQPAVSGLEECIIQHESGGNSQAVSGQYEGIGQWSPEAWAQDGGHKYAPTPLGATYAQQLSIFTGEGVSGMEDQQGQYDGCS